MRMNYLMAVSLLLGAQLLAGCQSTRWHGAGAVSTPRSPEIASVAAAPDEGAAQIAAGRKALDQGNVSAAVTAFRTARFFPEHAAAAANGLAVAYSRIGRADLTERFFRQAIALAPQNDQYRANLARFEGLHAIVPSPAPVGAIAAGVPASASTPKRIVRIAPGVVAQAPETRIVRLSAHEVRIGAGNSPAATGSAAAPARRIAAIGTGASAYPVRVLLSGGERTAASARPAYPVRVMLTASDR